MNVCALDAMGLLASRHTSMHVVLKFNLSRFYSIGATSRDAVKTCNTCGGKGIRLGFVLSLRLSLFPLPQIPHVLPFFF